MSAAVTVWFLPLLSQASLLSCGQRMCLIVSRGGGPRSNVNIGFFWIVEPHFCSDLGVPWEQKKTYWFSSGPVGHWNFLMPAQTCNLSAIFSTGFKPKTPKAQFWVGGLLLELCRQSLKIWRLPLPRPLVSSVWLRLYDGDIILVMQICA